MRTPPSPDIWHRALPAAAAGRLRPGEAHLWLLSLADPPLPAQQLAGMLSGDERDRASRFHFEADRRHFEAGRGLLRWVLGHYAGVDPASVQFSYAPNGKPCLTHPESALQFNLSHSGGWALIGLTLGQQIGVDLEVMRDLPELLNIARTNFAPAEVEALLQLPPELRQAGYFACWTRKEAYIKAVGAGLSLRLDQFEVSVDPGQPAVLRAIGGSAAAARDWTLLGLRPFDAAWMAAAVNGTATRWHLYGTE